MAAPKQESDLIEFKPFCLEIADSRHSLNKELSKIDLTNISEDDEKQTKDKYECIDLFKTANESKQKSLWKLLTVGRKNNYPQLLLLLSSDYSRERIKYFIKHKKTLSIQEWMKRSKGYKEIRDAPINSGVHHKKQLITSALDIFQTRLCNPINFHVLPEEKINDSIVYFATHIINAIALIKNENWKPRCQLDVWIIPQQIGDAHVNNPDVNNPDDDQFDDDDDEESDDDDDDDDDDGDEEKETLNEDIVLNDIEEHLKKTIGDKNYVTFDNFAKLKRQFMEKIKNDTENKRYCMIVKKKNPKQNENENENKNNENNNNFENIYMYKPLKHHNIPISCIPEWSIQASLTDILPPITGKQGLNGKMFLLSLQKDQSNEIRAWLIMRNTIYRFYTSDILNILPHFFVQNKENKITEKIYKQLKVLISKNPIPDVIFDKFNHQKHNEEEIVSYDDLWEI